MGDQKRTILRKESEDNNKKLGEYPFGRVKIVVWMSNLGVRAVSML